MDAAGGRVRPCLQTDVGPAAEDLHQRPRPNLERAIEVSHVLRESDQGGVHLSVTGKSDRSHHDGQDAVRPVVHELAPGIVVG